MEVEDTEDYYQKLFDEFQTTVENTKNIANERNNTINELNSYLDISQNKIGSDGKKLLSIPKNFNAIVDSMSREDLVSTDDKPWTKYLLDKKFEDDLANDFGGRYKAMVVEEAAQSKVNIGMAEIHMLDTQLKSLSKKEAFLNNINCEKNSESNYAEPSSPSSVFSKKNETFYFTRMKGESRGCSEKSFSPKSSSVRSFSPRSLSEDKIDDSDYHQAHLDVISDFTSQEFDQNDEILLPHEKSKSKKNYLKDNIDAVKSRTKFTQEEEERLRQLLCEDEPGDSGMESVQEEAVGVVASISTIFGFTIQQKSAIERIDEQLEQLSLSAVPPTPSQCGSSSRAASVQTYSSLSYGGSSRVLADHKEYQDLQQQLSQQPAVGSSGALDTLAEQRLERLRKEYEKDLEQRLSYFKNTPLDLSELAHSAAGPPNSLRQDIDRMVAELQSAGPVPVDRRAVERLLETQQSLVKALARSRGDPQPVAPPQPAPPSSPAPRPSPRDQCFLPPIGPVQSAKIQPPAPADNRLRFPVIV